MRTTLAISLVLGLAVAGCGGKGAKAPEASKLNVTHIEPTAAAPTTPIVIHGSGFMAESRSIQVYLGETPANVLSVDSDTDLQVEVPAGEAGAAVDVKLVFDPGGEITLPHAFTFTPGA
jgi:hypothetical protein